ncbi:hypothetical protein EUGRSUZ_F00794 [Eucalyptus grandis]|uniref:Uncharacterized protein n=2 Tax=Eucalyptus grandis TaxID=71139 RepID=A0ACC3KDA3_EUCGR|nr:hypothetical protein EUGRSUZ_F00794 [Eucalyptus grandis]
MLRLLCKNPDVCKAVLQEEEEIAKSKTSGEPLTWEDLARMKYIWRVAMETLRMVPPVFGGFRLASRDIDYGGYLIPRGWQLQSINLVTLYSWELCSDDQYIGDPLLVPTQGLLFRNVPKIQK